MKDPHGLHQPSIPVSYLQLLVEILAERGVDLDRLLAGVAIEPDLLSRPEARMSPYQWTQLALNAVRLSGDPGLGYEYGLRMRTSAHGFLGYATLSCASVREAMEITIRYFQARQRDFSMRLSTDDDYGTIEVRENHPIPVLRAFFYENILIGLARGAVTIVGTGLTDFSGGEIWFDWPEPAYHAAYRDRLPPIRFSRPVNALRFPVRLLELRPTLADPFASKQAIAQCERELEQAGGSDDPIGLRVCAALVLSPQGGYPSQDHVAASLHMSSRSLARKLQASGNSYLQLLEQARRRDACELIGRGGLDLQAIAARLGYTNPANFTRAFRKWTGESPSQYRHKVSLDAAFR